MKRPLLLCLAFATSMWTSAYADYPKVYVHEVAIQDDFEYTETFRGDADQVEDVKADLLDELYEARSHACYIAHVDSNGPKGAIQGPTRFITGAGFVGFALGCLKGSPTAVGASIFVIVLSLAAGQLDFMTPDLAVLFVDHNGLVRKSFRLADYSTFDQKSITQALRNEAYQLALKEAGPMFKAVPSPSVNRDFENVLQKSLIQRR